MKTQRNFFVVLIVLALLSVSGISVVSAATTCTFTVTGTSMKLNGNCTTDETIYVPQGFTLNGQGHTILVTDPAGDSFKGAVVKNAGTVAHVINLRIRAPNLAVACHSYPDYLTGIWFENARGSIKNNTIVALFQTDSGCQEGDAIVAENTGAYVNVEI
ncbi:MAG: hypothetical protein H7X77_09565, partial [Anaerolineae bacterium]|nr:hypothetical protein [Anaerolineae bacterium]